MKDDGRAAASKTGDIPVSDFSYHLAVLVGNGWAFVSCKYYKVRRGIFLGHGPAAAQR